MESFRVVSCDVVRIVEGTGSKGYIEMDVNAFLCASGLDDL